MKNKTSSIEYFSMEEVSVRGFCDFCRNNIPLVIAVSFTLFFAYGIRLFWYSIGIDAELFLVDESSILNLLLSIGRFGLVLLLKLGSIKGINPFTEFFTAFCLIWFFTISWCYIIAIFSRDTTRNNKLIPFALLFMTTPIWAERFYAIFEATEHALTISICPYVIYLLFKGLLDNEKVKITCAFVLLVFISSVYQAIVPMFCCGVFICFVLFQEHSEYDPRIYRNLCLKLFITLLGSLAVYFFINKIVISAVFHDKIILPAVYDFGESKNTDVYFQWGKRSFRENIIAISSLGYILTIGHIPMIQRIVHPIIVHYPGATIRAVELFDRLSRIHGNILLLPATVLFFIKITFVMCKTITEGRRLLYMLAGICIPLCIFLLAIFEGSKTVLRAVYAMPLASAFMLFYLIRTYKKKAAAVVTCLALLMVVYQAKITAQLFYSDQVRYNEDVRFAYELDNLITQVQPDNGKLPVLLVGIYQTPSQSNTNLMIGETIGHSFFGWGTRNPYETSYRGLAFMKTLGINFDMPDENRIEKVFREAASMPAYPKAGCVMIIQDCIVVKMSDDIIGDMFI